MTDFESSVAWFATGGAVGAIICGILGGWTWEVFAVLSTALVVAGVLISLRDGTEPK